MAKAKSAIAYSVYFYTQKEVLPNSLQTKQSVYDLFKKYGRILNVMFSPTKKENMYQYGFCNYETEESAKQAIAELNGIELEGMKLTVKFTINHTIEYKYVASTQMVYEFPEYYSMKNVTEHFKQFAEVESVSKVDDNSTKYSVTFTSLQGATRCDDLWDAIPFKTEAEINKVRNAVLLTGVCIASGVAAASLFFLMKRRRN